jgi:hypothetical protein
MNNKLELKHLPPYLPYGLQCRVWKPSHIHNNKIVKLVGLINKDCGCFTQNNYYYDEFKPILRPLSDLTTSHNIFEDKAICFIDESDNGGSFTIDDIYFKYKESSFSDWRNAYLLLLENHFDVFGLIEKGLAIDINTL